MWSQNINPLAWPAIRELREATAGEVAAPGKLGFVLVNTVSVNDPSPGSCSGSTHRLFTILRLTKWWCIIIIDRASHGAPVPLEQCGSDFSRNAKRSSRSAVRVVRTKYVTLQHIGHQLPISSTNSSYKFSPYPSIICAQTRVVVIP